MKDKKLSSAKQQEVRKKTNELKYQELVEKLKRELKS